MRDEDVVRPAGKVKNPHAVALGQIKSAKKAAANRLKKGGRPKGSKDSYKRTRRKKKELEQEKP